MENTLLSRSIKECLACGSENVIKNKCSNCKSTLFYLTKTKNNRKDCEIYNKIIRKIKKDTGISIPVIDSLFSFGLLSSLTNVIIKRDPLGIISITLPEKILFIENYESNLEYVLASFPSYNSNYKFNENSNYFLENKNKKFHIFLKLNYSNQLLCCIKYLEKETLPYNIELLNESEKEELEEQIQYQMYDIAGIGDLFIEDTPVFVKTISLDSLDLSNKFQDTEENHLKMNTEIEKFYNSVELMIYDFREKNKFIFQRSLLEIELDTF